MALAAPDILPTEVPKSRSPDGKFALYYKPFVHGAAGSPEFTVYFRDAGLACVSDQLNPDFKDNYLGKPGVLWTHGELNSWDTQALLNMVCRSNEYHLKGQSFDSGFSYSVTWTPDSQWVVIEGGAHKFWHMTAYHWTGKGFEQIDLGRLSALIDEYFKAHETDFFVQQLGLDKKVKAIRSRDYDPAYVGWRQDGMFAVNGYPFLLNNARYGAFREKLGEIYFLVDYRETDHLRILGACR